MTMTSWTGFSLLWGLVVGLLLVHVVGIAADDENYVIMIDAGSSGSRIHVHKYTQAPSTTLLPTISASVNKKVKPGLSSYAKKPQEVQTVVADLVAFAKENIPMNKWSTTPFHIQATAGLRSITPEQSHAILEVVRDELLKTQFLFQRSWARIIPGSDEGINGWLATNYLLGVWKQESNSPPSTTGVVEMGGASIQVTYVPKQVQEDEKSELIQMQIAGHTYYIYTYSYLSYGLQAAELAFKKNAIEDIEEKGNPCYPVGLKHSATGSFDQCLNLVSKHLFDKEATCTKHTCSFNGIYQPIFTDADDFLAIENFFYTTQFFGVQTDLTTRHIISVLYEKGTEYCSLPWKTIKSKHEKTAEQELASYCFATAYEHSMLTHALGFDPKSRIKAIREIDGKPIDWELGAVVRELLRYQDMKEKYGHSPDSEYSDIDSSETIRQRITNTVQKQIGVTVNDGTSYSYFTLISIFIILAVAIGYLIHRRNKKTCLPEDTLANLGYSSKPSHLVV